LLRNAAEDKQTVRSLVQDKDELREEVDSLIYKMQLIVNERDSLKQKLALASDKDKLIKHV